VISRVASSSRVISSSDSSSDNDSSLDSVSSIGRYSSGDINYIRPKTLLDTVENGTQSVIGCTRGRNVNEVLRVLG